MDKVFQRTYYFTLFLVITGIILMVLAALLLLNDESMGFIGIAVTGGLLLLAALAFYKLEISILNGKLIICFGVGWISREIPIKQIDSDSIHVTKVSPLVGVGLRYDLKGNTYYSVKFGKAVGFKLKNRSKNLLIGVHQPEKLADALRQAVAESDS